jgi:hypothetical protein
VLVAFNHFIMAQTTIDIESPILTEVKNLQRQDGRSMSKIVSQLLAEPLAQRKNKAKVSRFKWHSRRMRAFIDLSDKDVLYKNLDRGKH